MGSGSITGVNTPTQNLTLNPNPNPNSNPSPNPKPNPDRGQAHTARYVDSWRENASTAKLPTTTAERE